MTAQEARQRYIDLYLIPEKYKHILTPIYNKITNGINNKTNKVEDIFQGICIDLLLDEDIDNILKILTMIDGYRINLIEVKGKYKTKYYDLMF